MQAQRYRSTTTSLTYGWRESAGTVPYLGASQARQSEAGRDLPRNTEVFIKLQFDLDEAKEWLRGPAGLRLLTPMSNHPWHISRNNTPQQHTPRRPG